MKTTVNHANFGSATRKGLTRAQDARGQNTGLWDNFEPIGQLEKFKFSPFSVAPMAHRRHPVGHFHLQVAP